MINREIYFRDPTTIELLNNGVSKVSEFGDDQRQLRTLRFELESFVCDGEYARGMERILKAYLDGLGREEQKAVWVSGFFGSGKSHLVKMLRYLWTDYTFADGATARSLVRVPSEIADLLKELSTRSKPLGGLQAAAGTLGAGSMNNVRLAFIQLILRSVGLPEDLAHARFMLWLRSEGLEAVVAKTLQDAGCDLWDEVVNMNYSVKLAEALLSAAPKYGTVPNVQEAIRAGFPEVTSPTITEALDFLKQVFGDRHGLPCTLLVVDEVQQFIGENIQRAMDVQEIAEHCCTELNQRLLLIGTGQSALTGTPSLQKIQARFAVRVQLSDTDVESVIRKTVLRKKPEVDPVITQILAASQGELARHLQNTRFAANSEDNQFLVADYPLLPTRRRFWEKVLRNTDHSGTKAQLRSQLQIVFEATKQTAAANVGTVVSADFIYDQISTDLLNSGELEREYDEIIRKQRNGTADGDLRSSLCALIFLIGKLPRTPGADDGVRANAETLVDLLVRDLKTDRPRLEQQVPGLLKQLVDSGNLMAVESEYRLQTREGVVWTQDFNRRRTAVLSDEQRINSRRVELLRDAVKLALRPVSLQQGTSRQPRKLISELSSSRPGSNSDEVTLWMRDGWSDEPASVLNDARGAGVSITRSFVRPLQLRLPHKRLSMLTARRELQRRSRLEKRSKRTWPSQRIGSRRCLGTSPGAPRYTLAEATRLMALSWLIRLSSPPTMLWSGSSLNSLRRTMRTGARWSLAPARAIPAHSRKSPMPAIPPRILCAAVSSIRSEPARRGRIFAITSGALHSGGPRMRSTAPSTFCWLPGTSVRLSTVSRLPLRFPRTRLGSSVSM
jgi:hypothetical protein